MLVKTFSDLLDGHDSAEIRCLYTDRLVRKLRRVGGEVVVDVTDGTPPIRVSADAVIRHEPWVFDRGNMVFDRGCVLNPSVLPDGLGTTLKICGEGDPVIFPDGTTSPALPF